MGKFTFRISREYEADTAEEAQALADAEADKSNMDCPDDCSEDESGNSESTDFAAHLIKGSEA